MPAQSRYPYQGLGFSPLKTISFLFVLLFSAGINNSWAKPPYVVMPYVQTGDSGTVTPAGVPWADITHLNEAFGKVHTTTPFATFNQPAAWSTMVSTAHTNNTRINISFGGAGTSDATWSTATNATNLANFESQILAIVSANNFDGVDIDWEFSTATDKAQFMSLLQDLATQLHALTAYDGKPKTITFYISPGSAICGVDWATAGTVVDYGVQGGYDYNVTASGVKYNGPVSLPNAAGVSFTDCFFVQRPLDSSSNISSIVSKGFPINKVVLGCPFYIEDAGNTPLYTVLSSGTLVSSATGTLEMESVYNYGGSNYGVNDHDSFCAKINWAVGQMGMPGISMWELGNAYPTTGAPVASLWNVIGGNDACVTVWTPTPTFTTNPSLTVTNTPTVTNSFTPTFTRTYTFTRTFTNTPTNTSTLTWTGTFTPTFTPTVTWTPTLTNSPTNSMTFTPTGSATATPTFSFTSSFTFSSTFTTTPTASFTSTATTTSTGTFTPTLTATNSSTPTVLVSPSPTSSGQPVLFPNPISGPGPVKVRVHLSSTDSVDVKFLTTAFRRVNEFTSPELPPGVYDLPLELTDNWGTDLANGVYYVVVTTSSGTNVLKMLVIR